LESLCADAVWRKHFTSRLLLPELLPPKQNKMLLLLLKQNKMLPLHDRPLSELLPKLLLVISELPYKLVSGLCNPCD
jgi:hypothetical protein